MNTLMMDIMKSKNSAHAEHASLSMNAVIAEQPIIENIKQEKPPV